MAASGTAGTGYAGGFGDTGSGAGVVSGSQTGTTSIGAWNYRIVVDKDGNVYYEYLIRSTLTGAAQNIDLHLHYYLEVKRISMTFSDSTTKTFTIDLYANITNTLLRLVSESFNINQYVEYVDIKRIVLWAQFLRFAFTASTNGKTVDISVFTEQIPTHPLPIEVLKAQL